MALGGTARPGLVTLVRGAKAVATSAMTFRRAAANATRMLVNGAPGGVAWLPDGRPFAVLSFTVVRGRIVEIDVLADPERLARLDLGVPGTEGRAAN
jgi:RNA polymerase sigma-70 factor (ECF subfamily)